MSIQTDSGLLPPDEVREWLVFAEELGHRKSARLCRAYLALWDEREREQQLSDRLFAARRTLAGRAADLLERCMALECRIENIMAEES